ncbi:PLC-like phosphodiesterase [Cercophora samala]|uniref:PLC-like phosphodiesterase n=1 Tax=Cercophora samala TaxID=330535 RepID=A0AA39ZN25_9PEZI|nr:PLC-like phosphodiesterase [Cercophora samala]
MVNLCFTTSLLLSLSTVATSLSLPDHPSDTADLESRPPRPKARIPPPLSVGDYALQKALYDAEEIFGYYSYPPDPKKDTRINMNRCEWMSKLPDTAPLHQLNIPGTHASATWSLSDSSNLSSSFPYNSDKANNLPPTSHYQCQTSPLIDSLNAGIRFFDLSFGIDLTGKKLVFWHEKALLSETATVENVMFGFYTWLEQHPSEVIFLSLKYEAPNPTPLIPQPQIDSQIYTLLTTRPARRYIHQSKTLPPSLGHVRGKIILLRRFNLPHVTTHSHLPGIHLPPHHYPPANSQSPSSLTYGSRYDKQTLHISDWSSLSSSLSGESPLDHIKAKLLVIESHFFSASKGVTGQDYNGDYDLKAHHKSPKGGSKRSSSSIGWSGPQAVKTDGELWITFTSGENNAEGVTPEVLALGSEDTEDSEGYRMGVNKGLCKLLRRYRGKRLGIIVVDFWEGEHGDLIGAILGDWGSNGRYNRPGGRGEEYC